MIWAPVSSVVIQRSCGVFQDESEFVRSADEDDQVRFAVAHGHAVWWRLLRFLPHAFLWFSLRENGVLLYANYLSFIFDWNIPSRLSFLIFRVRSVTTWRNKSGIPFSFGRVCGLDWIPHIF